MRTWVLLPILATAGLLTSSCAATYSPHAASLRTCAEQEDTAESRNRCIQSLEDLPGEPPQCSRTRTVAGEDAFEPIGTDRQTELLKETQYLRHEAWEAISNTPLMYRVDWGHTLVGDESHNAMEWIRGGLLGRDAAITIGATPTTRTLLGVPIDETGRLNEDFVKSASSASLKEAATALDALHRQVSALPARLHDFFTGFYMALDKAQGTTVCYRQAADAERRMAKQTAGILQVIGSSRDALRARYSAKVEAEAAVVRDEAAAWSALDTGPCREAKTATACDALEAFVARFPAGAHAAEAKEILAAVQGTMGALRDEAAWKAAVGPCTRPKTSSDCNAAKQYVAGHPNGAYVEEARRLLRLRAAVLAQLAAGEEAQRRAGVMRAQTACINQCTVVLRSCQRDCSAGAPQAMPACQKTCLSAFHESCVAGCRK